MNERAKAVSTALSRELKIKKKTKRKPTDMIVWFSFI